MPDDREAIRRTKATWDGMKRRCLHEDNPEYKNYGARGISICARWRESFRNFVEDMGTRPPGMSIDRIDNNGNYEPGNCRWATPAQQRRNQRDNVWLTFNGKTQTREDWARELGINSRTLERRTKAGWPTEKALSLKNHNGPGEKNPAAVLTNDQATQIYSLYSTGNYTCKELGRKFGVARGTVGKVIRGDTFKEIILRGGRDA